MTAAVDAALVHRLAAEQALASGHRLLDPVRLAAAAGLGPDRFHAAVAALVAGRVLDAHTFGSLVTLARLTEAGLRAHLAATRPDLDGVRRRLAGLVEAEAAAGRLRRPLDLPGAVGEPALLVETLLDERRDAGDLVFSPAAGGRFVLHRVGRAERER